MGFNIFDRYIFCKFVKTFFLCYFLLLFFYSCADFCSKFSDFIDEGITWGMVLVSFPFYYFINTFVLFDMLFPLLLFTAAVATLGYMNRQHEIIAFLALGASPTRILAPIIIGALLLSGIFTYIREEYLPQRLTDISLKPAEFIQKTCRYYPKRDCNLETDNEAAKRYEELVQKRDEFSVTRVYDDYSLISVDGDKILLSQRKILKPSISLNAQYLDIYGKRLIAKEGTYLEADNSRPSGWLLSEVSAPAELIKNPSLQNPDSGEKVVYSPYDTSWLGETEVFVSSSVEPIQLAAGDNWWMYGSVMRLNSCIKNPAFGREAFSLIIRVHTRILRPITDLLPLFLGIPFVFLKNDKNFVVAITRGVLWTGAYLIGQFACTYLGNKYDMPFLGIWGSLLVFVPIAAVIYGELFRKNVRQTT